MKFSNRLEAYLSWISTGIKPEDFDDEPRNMTEYWLQGEADRLDRMSGNETPVATRSLKKGAGAEDVKYDYADLENKPIQPYPAGTVIPIEGSEVSFEAGMTLHFNKSKEDEIGEWLKTLTYVVAQEGGIPSAEIIGIIDGQTRPDSNMLGAIKFPPQYTGLDHDVYVLECIPDINRMDLLCFPYATDSCSITPLGITLEKGVNIENVDVIQTNTLPIETVLEPWANDYISLVAAPALEENKYYFTLPEVRHPVKGEEISLDDLSNMNKEAFLADIPNFTYSTGEMEAIVTINSPTPSTGEHDFNVFMGAMKDDLLGEQDEDIILILMIYPAYASKHKNSSASGPFGSTVYFDENGWVRQIEDTPVTYEMIIEQSKEMVKDTKLYYTSGHCDDAFTMEVPSIISQYQHGKNKEIAVKEPLYEHQIRVTYNESDLKKANLFFKIITSTSTIMTDKDVYEYFRDNLDNCDYYPCTGCYQGYNVYGISSYVNLDSNYTLMINFNSNMQQLYDSYKTITDNVIKLI